MRKMQDQERKKKIKEKKLKREIKPNNSQQSLTFT